MTVIYQTTITRIGASATDALSDHDAHHTCVKARRPGSSKSIASFIATAS